MNDKIAIFLIFVMLFIGVGGYYYWFVEMPLKNEIKNLEVEKNKLRSNMKNEQRLRDELDEKKNILDKTKKEYDIILQSTISDKNMSVPDLIRVVRNYAKQAKVEFNEIKINKLFSYEYYDELPMEFNFTGPYHHMGRMMARLENLKLINARKGKINLQPHKQAKKSSSSFGRSRFGFNEEEEEKNEISLDLTASSFIFKDKGGDLGAQTF